MMSDSIKRYHKPLLLFVGLALVLVLAVAESGLGLTIFGTTGNTTLNTYSEYSIIGVNEQGLYTIANATTLTLQDNTDGWIEYSDTTYNNTNRLTIGNTLQNFSMSTYTTREEELPIGLNNLSWFNGTHLLTDKAGNTFLYRWRFKAEPQVANAYCEIYYKLDGIVLPARQISFPRGINVEQIGAFTNLEYALDEWYTNGAQVQIECPRGDVELWDIELTIQRLHIGKGVYP